MRVPIFETTGLEQDMFENPQDNEGLFAFAEACQDADSQQVPSWQLPDIMSRGSLLSQIAAKKAILATLAGAELSGFKIHNPQPVVLEASIRILHGRIARLEGVTSKLDPDDADINVTIVPTEAPALVTGIPGQRSRPTTDMATKSFSKTPDLSWQEGGKCSRADPETFFPERGGSTKEAKKVCVGCIVKEQCLKYALESNEQFGVWGGLSELERRRLKKTRQRESAAQV